MKQFLLLAAVLNIAFCYCQNKDDYQDMSADQYISLLIANKYPKYHLIPRLNKADIPVLLKNAGNNTLIDNYPLPSFSAANHGKQKAGMIILYTIESIRTQKENGIATHPYISDTTDLQRKVGLEELVPLYNSWWEQHKNKTAEELKNTDPLAGTPFRW